LCRIRSYKYSVYGLAHVDGKLLKNEDRVKKVVMSESWRKLPYDESKVNLSSKRLARRLFEWRPEWKQFAQMTAPEASDDWQILVEIPSPLGDPDRAITIFLDDGDVVSIGFSYWHEHLEFFDTDDEVHSELRRLLLGILSDQLVLCLEGDLAGQWCSSLVSVSDTASILDMITAPDSSGKVRLISFNGTTDDDLDVAELHEEEVIALRLGPKRPL